MRWNPKSVEVLLLNLESVHGRARILRRASATDELISCILSQNTTDANSFPTFARLKSAYPAWDAVAELQTTDLASHIQKAGLANQKARAIGEALQRIRKKFGNYELEPLAELPLPQAVEWLRSLPRVGPKTVAIVCLFSLGLPGNPVDTHVSRVCRRLGIFPDQVPDSKAHLILDRIVPPHLTARLHLAFIQHGRNICRPTKPNCESCPVNSMCKGRYLAS